MSGLEEKALLEALSSGSLRSLEDALKDAIQTAPDYWRTEFYQKGGSCDKLRAVISGELDRLNEDQCNRAVSRLHGVLEITQDSQIAQTISPLINYQRSKAPEQSPITKLSVEETALLATFENSHSETIERAFHDALRTAPRFEDTESPEAIASRQRFATILADGLKALNHDQKSERVRRILKRAALAAPPSEGFSIVWMQLESILPSQPIEQVVEQQSKCTSPLARIVLPSRLSPREQAIRAGRITPARATAG